MGLKVTLNGQAREFESLEEDAGLDAVVGVLQLKADRVAVEWNGEIVPRTRWSATKVKAGDRLEVVHFVGGGLS